MIIDNLLEKEIVCFVEKEVEVSVRFCYVFFIIKYSFIVFFFGMIFMDLVF